MSMASTKRRLLTAAGLAAAFMLQPAGAQTIDNSNLGSAVIVPYYTVNGNFRTLVNVTNTTANHLVIKVRLHEFRNSRDALDFNVGLSPFDVWTAFIQDNGNGIPELRTTDKSCTAPLRIASTATGQTGSPVFANPVAYSSGPGFSFRDHTATDGQVTGSDPSVTPPGNLDSLPRIAEGYIEILTMGEDVGTTLPATNTGEVAAGAELTSIQQTADVRGSTSYYAEHVNGVPRNCTIFSQDFQANVTDFPTYTIAENAGATEPTPATHTVGGIAGSGNPIAHNYWDLATATTLTGTANSLSGRNNALSGGDRFIPRITATTVNAAGYGPITSTNPLKVNATLASRNNGYAAGIESMHVAGWGNGTEQVTAQRFPYFLEPTIAGHDGLWTMSALDGLDTLIGFNVISNEWANGGENSARTDWVVTFPTKAFHVDEDVRNIQAACSVWRNRNAAHVGGGVPLTPATDYASNFYNGFGTASSSNYVPRRFCAPNGTATAANGVVDCPASLAGISDGFAVDAEYCGIGRFALDTVNFQSNNTGQKLLEVTYNFYDREEFEAVAEVELIDISPFPPVPPADAANLRYEANVLAVGGAAPTSVLASSAAESVAINLSGAVQGWMQMTFGTDVPVTGFVYKQRDFGNAALNFAQATPHGYQ